MPIISIANPKGGAGKTTLAFILADQLSINGASVAVVDADPNTKTHVFTETYDQFLAAKQAAEDAGEL